MAEDRARRFEQAADRARHLVAPVYREGLDAEGARDLREIGIVGQIDLREILLEEQFLPLPDHAELAVVEQQDLEREAVAPDRRQLVDVHHDRAVAAHRQHGRVRIGEQRPDPGRDAIAHRAETGAGQVRVRAGEAAMLRHPHLVLADIAGDDQIVGRRLAQRLQHRRRVDAAPRRIIGRRPAHGIGCAFGAPGLDLRHRDKLVEELRGITRDADLRPTQLADLGRIAVDVDHLRARLERVELAGGAIVEARADADQEIAGVHRIVGGARAVHPDHAEEARRVGGQRAKALQRGDRGDPGARRKAPRRNLRAGDADAAAEIEDRPRRRRDQRVGAGDRVRIGREPERRRGRRGG